MYVAGFSGSSRIRFLPVGARSRRSFVAQRGHHAARSSNWAILLLLNNIDITSTNKYIYLLKSNSICYKLLYIIKTK